MKKSTKKLDRPKGETTFRVHFGISPRFRVAVTGRSPGACHRKPRLPEVLFWPPRVEVQVCQSALWETSLWDGFPSKDEHPFFDGACHPEGSPFSNSVSEPVIEAQVLVDQKASHASSPSILSLRLLLTITNSVPAGRRGDEL